GAAAIGAALASQDLVPHPDRLGAAVLVPFMVAVAALVTLLERTAILQARAVERYRRLESKSDTVLAHVADAIVVTGEGGVVVQCNRAARTMVGGGDDLGRRGCEQALALHQGERRLDCSVDCGLLRLAGGTNASGVEVWREGPSGVRQPLLADAVAVESPGDRTEVVHSFRDITGLKQAEEAKTLFLATATHELKTPLTVISGFAETLARYDHIPPEVQSAALDAIRSRAAELTHIVDRLLLSSRIEAGRLRLAVERIDPGPIVAERVAVLAPALHRDIGCRVDDGLPLVEGTPQALETVVDHLVDNAVKYSPDGQPVEVRVQQGEPGVRIEVSDQGIGMDPEQTARCFDKFWQAESTDVRRFGGTGIGLYIVRSLVEAMGGSLSVRSVAGAGTTFTVGLVATRDRLTEASGEHLAEDPGVGERTSIREFMRQIGIRERT
ncbi:MAG TPA: HAMP domain-containing sensor histidine kinase, partial [Acidimicrobiales bacterium]|nr:HAMP domain-containing sensor histidine kinase [Acidimicrobiales bacterium]